MIVPIAQISKSPALDADQRQRVKILRRSLRAYTELASDRFKELLAMGPA